MKKPPTPREPSARLTQKVTIKNVDPDRDFLLVIAYQLKPGIADPNLFSPTIIDLGIFPVIECINARDDRLLKNGRWFGYYETPAILSKIGIAKKIAGKTLDDTTYGRKESEGKDYNEDTNFGKLARIPYAPLQIFLKKHGYKELASLRKRRRDKENAETDVVVLSNRKGKGKPNVKKTLKEAQVTYNETSLFAQIELFDAKNR